MDCGDSRTLPVAWHPGCVCPCHLCGTECSSWWERGAWHAGSSRGREMECGACTGGLACPANWESFILALSLSLSLPPVKCFTGPRAERCFHPSSSSSTFLKRPLPPTPTQRGRFPFAPGLQVDPAFPQRLQDSLKSSRVVNWLNRGLEKASDNYTQRT